MFCRINSDLISVLNLEKEKRQIFFLFVLSVLMTAIETVGVSLIMPFVQMALNFGEVHRNKYYERLYQLFAFESEKNFVLVFGIFLAVFFVVRACYLVFYNYRVSRHTKTIYRRVAGKLFSSFLGLSYRQFVERNGSQLAQMIVTEANSVAALSRTMILALGDMLTILVIYVFLLYMNWKITLVLTGFLGLNVWLLMNTVTRQIKKTGSERVESNRQLFKMLLESFGNFKMIKLRSSEESITAVFQRIMKDLMKISISNETLQQIPRLLLELIGFVLIIAVVIYWIIVHDSNITGIMGILSVFLFAMYRLLPAFNRVLTGYNQVAFLNSSLELIRENLASERQVTGNQTIAFDKLIEMKGVSFEYLPGEPLFQKVDLRINRGDKIAFVGPSGSGKSTIVDLIIGLYEPADGIISIDGTILDQGNIRSWRKMIGYIPQDIFLLDASVAQNVALQPEHEIDRERVVEVLKDAHVFEFLTGLRDGIETVVGDRGVKLSGGQKQRIAIARALYHRPDILVLDEATSSLDSGTEKEIMNNIYEAGRDKTLIVIAHRLSTLTRCDRIVTMKHGRLRELSNTEIPELQREGWDDLQ
jgi:ATP-binding cassette subfamily B protein